MQSCPRFEGSPYSECWCPVLYSVVAFLFKKESSMYIHGAILYSQKVQRCISLHLAWHLVGRHSGKKGRQ